MRPGQRRERIDATLSAAYAEGLLSDDTFASRLNRLVAPGALRAEELVGDVTLRGVGRGRRSRWRAALARLRSAESIARPRNPAPLLALDWSGATGTLLVGRDEDCDVVLDDPTVSRRHAVLRFRDGGWVLHDLGSLNGTSLNGDPVVRSRLVPGDLVAFAGHRLRVD